MTKSKLSQQLAVDNLKIGSRVYSSRLIVGTGKYPSEDIASKAINSSGAELVTLAIKRFSQQDAISNILEVIGDKSFFLILRALSMQKKLLGLHNYQESYLKQI